MIGRAARANFAGHSHSIPTMRLPTISSAWRWRFRDGSANLCPRASSRSELDPLSPRIPIDNIFAYAWQGKYQGAKEQTKRAADLDPAYFFPQMAYGWIDIEAGKTRDAIPDLLRAKAMESPAFVTAFLRTPMGPPGTGPTRWRRWTTRKNVVAWSCSAFQPGAGVYRSGRSRTRVGLP